MSQRAERQVSVFKIIKTNFNVNCVLIYEEDHMTAYFPFQYLKAKIHNDQLKKK